MRGQVGVAGQVVARHQVERLAADDARAVELAAVAGSIGAKR